MCGSFISRQGLAPRPMQRHRLQTTLSPVSLCVTQSLRAGVELYLTRGHPKLFFGLNEQVIVGYLTSKQW